VGATSSLQWLPKGQLHPRLVEAGQTLGRFRAVLWQQGESDVIAKTSTATYVSNLKTIRHTAADAWNFEAPWLLAKSTHHPTVYNDAAGEGRIRAGYDELVKVPGFASGPDTDTLKGENRGDAKSRRHFSAIGQKRAAEMWFEVLKQQLNTRRPIHEALADLHLLEPAWASKVVQRESSVLLQNEGGSLEVRLAFPVDNILDVVSADGQHRFDVRDFTLSLLSTHVRLTKAAPFEAIKEKDLFPPKDSPNSYKHRIGHPEQNLLYRPGRWFHDRNVEITYRRRDNPEPIPTATGSLPKTMARLRDGKPLTLGVSGDSISTGLDASLTANAFPYQPGYPDLVAAQLEAKYRTSITLKNRAISGWSVANGVADLDKLLAEKPNLIVIAYGMNDVGWRDPAWFHKQTKTLLDRIRAADENIEVILVAPMLGNKEWIHTPREMFAKYRDELKSLTREGVILADVTDVWERMSKNKHDLDLTGNGLNHPNDFGHRLYAQAVLSMMQK
jgi:acyl-CoA thioesterase-1